MLNCPHKQFTSVYSSTLDDENTRFSSFMVTLCNTDYFDFCPFARWKMDNISFGGPVNPHIIPLNTNSIFSVSPSRQQWSKDYWTVLILFRGLNLRLFHHQLKWRLVFKAQCLCQGEGLVIDLWICFVLQLSFQNILTQCDGVLL